MVEHAGAEPLVVVQEEVHLVLLHHPVPTPPGGDQVLLRYDPLDLHVVPPRQRVPRHCVGEDSRRDCAAHPPLQVQLVQQGDVLECLRYSSLTSQVPIRAVTPLNLVW